MANEYQVTQIAAEVLKTTLGDAEVSAIYVEVLAAIQEVDPPIAPGLLTDFVDGFGDSTIFTVSVERRVYPSFADSGDEGFVYPIRQRIPKFTIKDVERNPYATNRPDDWEEQQRVLREQHNKLQAGDTTFDSGLLLKSTPKKLYTLGSLGRFFHETFGLVLARYVKFAGMVDADYQCAPVGRLRNSATLDWVVTNNLARSDPSLAMGFTFIADTPPDGYYGWMVIHGTNLVTAGPENDDLPVQGDIYTWTRTGYIGINSTGKPLAVRWDRPTESGILAGKLMIQIEGASPADLSDFVAAEAAPLQAQVTALESSVASHTARLGVLDATVASNASNITALQQGLQREEAARVRDITSVRNQIAQSADWSGSINGAVNSVRVEFAAALSGVDVKATNALTRIVGLESALRGFNLTLVNEQLNNLAVAVGTLSQSNINVDLTGLTAGQTIVTTSVSTPEGGTMDQFQPVDFKLVELLDYDNTTPATDGQVPTWDAVAGKFVPETPPSGPGGSFRGALVKKSTDQTTANYSTLTTVTWNAEEYDTDSIHDNSTNNSRLTVPSGVTKVKLYCTMSLAATTANDWISLRINKNGSPAVGLPFIRNESGATTGGIEASSAVIDVTSGDYFEAQMQVESDTSITVSANRSCFAMEIVK